MSVGSMDLMCVTEIMGKKASGVKWFQEYNGRSKDLLVCYIFSSEQWYKCWIFASNRQNTDTKRHFGLKNYVASHANGQII